MIARENNPDYLNSFLDYSVTILNKSPNSIKEYNYDLSTFLKYIKIHFGLTNETDFAKITINDIPISVIKQITLDDIHAFISYLATELHSKSATRARKVSSIRIFFKYLSAKAKLIDVNPAQNLETPKIDKRMPKYLTLEDSQRLLNVADNEDNRNYERDYAITTLFLNCGMRLSELVNINIKDIQFDECKMTVIGKGNKERTIYLNNACMRAISGYLEVRPKEGIDYKSKDALFLSERRERISNRTVQYIIKRELRQAGLDTTKYSVHKLRHTAATLMYQYRKCRYTCVTRTIRTRKHFYNRNLYTCCK
jgi:site-specific recombinase XerD